MKRNSIFVAAMMGAMTLVNAQTTTMTSKNGHEILPQTGDIAIGMDAVPVINFGLNAINIMNNTGQQAQHPGYVSGYAQVLSGKYFMSETQALRVRLGINTMNTSAKTFGDNPLTPTASFNGTAENILLMTSNNAMRNLFIGGGMEFRRGHNRLQGYYGGEVFLGFASTSTKNKFEIAYSKEAEDSLYIGTGSSRVLSAKSGTAITFGLRGFAGVEYFFAPKISIGAEFGWGLGLTTSARGKNVVENWGIEPGTTGTTNAVYEVETPGNTSGRQMGFGVDNGIGQGVLGGASGALMIHFHF